MSQSLSTSVSSPRQTQKKAATLLREYGIFRGNFFSKEQISKLRKIPAAQLKSFKDELLKNIDPKISKQHKRAHLIYCLEKVSNIQTCYQLEALKVIPRIIKLAIEKDLPLEALLKNGFVPAINLLKEGAPSASIEELGDFTIELALRAPKEKQPVEKFLSSLFYWGMQNIKQELTVGQVKSFGKFFADTTDLIPQDLTPRQFQDKSYTLGFLIMKMYWTDKLVDPSDESLTEKVLKQASALVELTGVDGNIYGGCVDPRGDIFSKTRELDSPYSLLNTLIELRKIFTSAKEKGLDPSELFVDYLLPAIKESPKKLTSNFLQLIGKFSITLSLKTKECGAGPTGQEPIFMHDFEKHNFKKTIRDLLRDLSKVNGETFLPQIATILSYGLNPLSHGAWRSDMDLIVDVLKAFEEDYNSDSLEEVRDFKLISF